MVSDPSQSRSVDGGIHLSALAGFALVAMFALGLLAFGFLDVVKPNAAFQWSFFGSAGVLLVWGSVLFGLAKRRGRTLALAVAFRKQHYVQATAQAVFLLYWGWYWRPVYDSAFLIGAQLVFAYAFDMLLCWSRRDRYTFGLGPFPVIFSINLFLWFADSQFYLQFALVALGFAAKELIRWNKDGRRVHIFNPSSFPLAVFSLGLILTGTSDLTWGQDIAITQFYPPHAYLVLFLIALPGQYLFGVASMTMSAVVATYVFGLLYYSATGIFFFYDSYIPIAVFLGMHLLFTDPSTAPRTEAGRIMFGVLYGFSTVALYVILGRSGLPTFYDKLLQVPVLNLSVQLLDRLAQSRWVRAFDPVALGRSLVPHQRNFGYMAAWALVFVVMSATQGVGDRHPGQWVPFWQQACGEGRAYACPYLADMQLRFCRSGSAWACNEAGILHVALARSGEDARRSDPLGATEPLERGCELGFEPACQNLVELTSGLGSLEQAPPTLLDYPIILRGTKGPITDRSPAALYARACSQGWEGTCGRFLED